MFNILEFLTKRHNTEIHADKIKKEIKGQYSDFNKSVKKMNRLLKKTVAEDIYIAIGGKEKK